MDFRIFLRFFFPEKNVVFFRNFFFPSGSSAFFRPHFSNSHEYHPYSSNWYPNFLWNFTSKSRVKVRLAIFSKFFRLFFDFYNLHIKPNVLNLTFFRRKLTSRKIATIEVGHFWSIWWARIYIWLLEGRGSSPPSPTLDARLARRASRIFLGQVM